MEEIARRIEANLEVIEEGIEAMDAFKVECERIRHRINYLEQELDREEALSRKPARSRGLIARLRTA